MRSSLVFFALTYLVSWAFFLAARALPGGGPLQGALILIGVVAPALVAIALTAQRDGWEATAALLRRAVTPPPGARWYVFALTYVLAVKLTVALIHRIATGAWPAFGQTPWFLIAGAILVSTPVQAGEEIGWRGYALPRLARRLGFGPASIVLGLVWATWHLPLFFITGAEYATQSFPVYALAVTGVSVAMAWLYWSTGGSLLITMLMHAAINNTSGIVPSPPTSTPLSWSAPLVAWLTVGLLWAGAVWFLVRMRDARAHAGASAGVEPTASPV